MKRIDVAAQRKERKPIVFPTPYPMRKPMRSEIVERGTDETVGRKPRPEELR